MMPRGIEKITPYGVPICLAGNELDYQGIRYEREKFICAAPQQDDSTAVCVLYVQSEPTVVIAQPNLGGRSRFR